MKKIRVAINGFGRIGRMVLRAITENPQWPIEVVAINDLGPVETNVYLLKYDSVHGRFANKITVQGDTIDIGNGPIKTLSNPNPASLPWSDLNIDLVMECSGRFTTRDQAALHLQAGAKKVLVSAPCDNADITVVYGVNHQNITQDHQVISNGSCTTNCLAPVAYALNETIGIKHGYMTTIHAYTGDQNLVDTLHKDLRRSRAAALSMIPTSTGAAKAVGLVLPELKGKLDGSAIRVPTANVSLVDLKFTSVKPTTIQEINNTIVSAAQGPLKGVLDVCNEPLVSIDFNHNPHSSTFDATQTQVIDSHFCRVLSWYDNEWGFANRMGDVACYTFSK